MVYKKSHFALTPLPELPVNKLGSKYMEVLCIGNLRVLEEHFYRLDGIPEAEKKAHARIIQKGYKALHEKIKERNGLNFLEMSRENNVDDRYISQLICGEGISTLIPWFEPPITQKELPNDFKDILDNKKSTYEPLESMVRKTVEAKKPDVLLSAMDYAINTIRNPLGQ